MNQDRGNRNQKERMLAGLCVAAAGFVFTAVFAGLFNGMSMEAGISMGVGLFTCFVVVVCTGLILSRLERRER